MLMIAMAGALGALSRYALSGAVYALLGSGFAWGTLIVNILGSFLLGLVMQIGLSTDVLPPHLRTAIAIGFLGAFTTFSTFSYETVQFLQEGSWGAASLNILSSVALGLIAVAAGIFAGRLIAGGA